MRKPRRTVDVLPAAPPISALTIEERLRALETSSGLHDATVTVIQEGAPEGTPHLQFACAGEAGDLIIHIRDFSSPAALAKLKADNEKHEPGPSLSMRPVEVPEKRQVATPELEPVPISRAELEELIGPVEPPLLRGLQPDELARVRELLESGFESDVDVAHALAIQENTLRLLH